MNEKIEWYREVLELEPASKVFFPLARLLTLNQQALEAIPVLQHGLARHPQFLEARLLLVELLFSQGKDKELAGEVDQVAALLGGYPGFWQAWGERLGGYDKTRDVGLAVSFLAATLQGKSLSWGDIIDYGLQRLLDAAAQEAASKPSEYSLGGAYVDDEEADLADADPDTALHYAREAGFEPEFILDLDAPTEQEATLLAEAALEPEGNYDEADALLEAEYDSVHAYSTDAQIQEVVAKLRPTAAEEEAASGRSVLYSDSGKQPTVRQVVAQLSLSDTKAKVAQPTSPLAASKQETVSWREPSGQDIHVHVKDKNAADAVPSPGVFVTTVQEEDLHEDDPDKEERFSLRTRSMAEILAEQGDLQEAITIFTELLENVPEEEHFALEARILELTQRMRSLPADAKGGTQARQVPVKNRLSTMLETLAQRLEPKVTL